MSEFKRDQIKPDDGLMDRSSAANHYFAQALTRA